MTNQSFSFNQFAVRAIPNADESFKGFVLRVCAENGIQTFDELALIFGCKLTKASFEADTEQYHFFANMIAASISLPLSTLKEEFATPHLAVDFDRAIKDIRLPSPKVCIECMNQPETAYIKSEWEVAHQTHCTAHSVKLTQACPCCGDEFRWVSDVLEGCPTCGVRWSDLNAESSQIPLYQSACDGLSGLELKEYLRALYQAFIYAGRPNDLMFNKFNEMPNNVSAVVELFEQAYHLIADPSAARTNFGYRVNKLKQLNDFSSFSQSSLEELALLPNLNHLDFLPYPSAKPSDKQFEQRSLVSQMRLSINGDPRVDLRDQMTLMSASKVLGVTTKTINAFVEVGLLKTCDGKVKASNRLISAKSVSELINKVTDHAEKHSEPETNSNLISIRCLNKCLPYFNCELPSLLINLKAANSKVYIDPNKAFSIWDLNVNRAEVICILESYFVKSIMFQDSKTKIRDLCNLSGGQFLKLSEKFDFQERKVCPTFANINSSQIGDFFNKYVLINRWAKISGVKLKEVLNFLRCESGLQRYTELENEEIYIFEQSEELSNSLTRFLLYHNREYKLLAQLCA